jgi:hypothetical protein
MFKSGADFILDEKQKGTEENELIRKYVYEAVASFGHSE